MVNWLLSAGDPGKKNENLTRWSERSKYSTNEKLANVKPISHKIKQLDRLGPDRPRNTVAVHALKTKLKSSDAKMTLEAFVKDPQRPPNWGGTSTVKKNYL